MKKSNDPRLTNGPQCGGDVEPANWRVVARSEGGSIKPPGWGKPWRPSPSWIAGRVAEELGPVVRGYVGIVVYRPDVDDAQVTAVQLRATLEGLLEGPVHVRVERWNETLEVWQPPDLVQTADQRELRVLATVKCESSAAAEALAETLRSQGELFLNRQRRTVVLGSTSEAQARILLEGHGAIRVQKLNGVMRKHLVGALLYDRWRDLEKGGWLSYDPSD